MKTRLLCEYLVLLYVGVGNGLHGEGGIPNVSSKNIIPLSFIQGAIRSDLAIAYNLCGGPFLVLRDPHPEPVLASHRVVAGPMKTIGHFS